MASVPGSRREPEAAVEQAVPDRVRGAVVAQAHRLVEVDLAERRVDRQADRIARLEARQRIGAGVAVARRVGLAVEGMDVADERALGAREVGDGGVRRDGGSRRRCRGSPRSRAAARGCAGRAATGGPTSSCGTPGRAAAACRLVETGSGPPVNQPMSGMRCSLLTIRSKTTCRSSASAIARSVSGRRAVGAAVVHVHVQVAAPPPARRPVGDRARARRSRGASRPRPPRACGAPAGTRARA